MKVSALAVLSASAVFAEANAGACDDLFGEVERCEDWTDSTCQQHIDEHGNEPPRCQPVSDEDDVFKAMGMDCPEFCEMKPNDFSCSGMVTRGERNAHFVAYGESAGDTVFNAAGKSLSQQNFGPIPMEINFLGTTYKHFFISGHGFIRLTTTTTQKPGDYYNYYKTLEKEKSSANSRAMISPYWGDFDLKKGGFMSYRFMADTEMPDMHKKYGYPKFNKGEIDSILVATWSQIKFTTYSSVNTDYTQTFQVIIAKMADGNVGLSFNFGDIEQDGYQYTGATECGENGKHHNVVGFVGKNGIWNHPYSKTDKADLVDDTSNCGITGRWNTMIKDGQIDGELYSDYTLEPKPMQVSIKTGSKGAKQFIASANKNPKLDIHGCHCAGLMGGESFGGPDAVDAVDNLCKQWKAAKACLSKNYGACSYQPEESYDVSANFDKCLTTGNGCGANSCAVDKHFMDKINAMTGKESWVAKPGNEQMCQPGMMDGYTDSCCGDAPLVKAYNMNAEACVDGKITGMENEGMEMEPMETGPMESGPGPLVMNGNMGSTGLLG